MLIEVKDKVVSLDIFEKKFVCDLNACKGACCVDGDSGAPLDKDELKILDDVLPAVKPYMTRKGKAAVEKIGTHVIDNAGDYTTTLTGPKEECAFVFFDAKGTALCAIEKARKDGKIGWRKPIRCT